MRGWVRSFAAPFASRGPLPDSCCHTPLHPALRGYKAASWRPESEETCTRAFNAAQGLSVHVWGLIVGGSYPAPADRPPPVPPPSPSPWGWAILFIC